MGEHTSFKHWLWRGGVYPNRFYDDDRTLHLPHLAHRKQETLRKSSEPHASDLAAKTMGEPYRKAGSCLIFTLLLVFVVVSGAVASRCSRLGGAGLNMAMYGTEAAAAVSIPPSSGFEAQYRNERRFDESRAAFDWIQPLGGRVAAETTVNGPVWRVTFDLTPLVDDQLSQLPTDLSIVAISLARTAITDRGVRHLKTQANLANLNLFQTSVSDQGMATIGEFAALQSLNLQRTNVSDAGMPYLLSLSGLRRLALDQTSVTDAGMVVLAGLPQLQFVSLRGTSISDVGLMTLGQSASLEIVILTGAKVTANGIEQLSRMRPGLQLVN
jgi:hypothetical protein